MKPLALKEYNRLADWMLDVHIRPADLLEASAVRHLEKLPRDIPKERVTSLLKRGAAMALAVDKWAGAGIWVVCRSDADYPARLKQHLKKQAPPILYGIGPIELLQTGGLAVVGSRNVDQAGEQFARQVACACAEQGVAIVSGGARGVDQTAMLASLDAGGTAVGVLADGLFKASVSKKFRDSIRERRLVLVSAFIPEARFNVGNAMGRNKHIYALADFALVVSAEHGKGGTWAGATEELKRPNGRPVFVRNEPTAPKGNRALIKLGAGAFPPPPWGSGLLAALSGKSAKKPPRTEKQLSIFSDTPAASAPLSVNEPEAGCPDIHSEIVEGQQHESQLVEVGPKSVFEAVLPIILETLKTWQKPADLAERLNIRKPQLDDWLKRAVDEGKIMRRIRPVQYKRSQ